MTIMADKSRALIATIDDDPIILTTILNTLSPYYDVRPFTSGAMFFKFLASRPVDLVLLDCIMPGMDGFEVMGQLQKDIKHREVPVLFLTSMEDPEGEVVALKNGAVDFLSKPIKPKVLLTRVRHQLELHRYRQHLKTLVEEKTSNLVRALNQLQVREDTILNMMATATDMRDPSTGAHIWRTSEFVKLLIEKLLEHPQKGYDLIHEQATDIIKSAKLHDVGKIGVPDYILRKPDKLTDEEFEIVKQHPLYGASLFDEFIDKDGEDSFLAIARDIALYHHEKWDGTGYPTGRKGKDIPLPARIVAIADMYDALISARPYKEAFTSEEAFEIIAKDNERHFDPYLVYIFIKTFNSFQAVSRSADKTS